MVDAALLAPRVTVLAAVNLDVELGAVGALLQTRRRKDDVLDVLDDLPPTSGPPGRHGP